MPALHAQPTQITAADVSMQESSADLPHAGAEQYVKGGLLTDLYCSGSQSSTGVGRTTASVTTSAKLLVPRMARTTVLRSLRLRKAQLAIISAASCSNSMAFAAR